MNDRTPTEATWLLKQGATPEQALERIAQRIAVWRDADPDEDESWESFYSAAFDMLSAEVDGIISAVAQPLAASPPAPAAEPVGLDIERIVNEAEIEWSYREDDDRYPRDFWHARISYGPLRTDWTSYGQQEASTLPDDVKAAAEIELRGVIRSMATSLPLYTHPLDAAAIRAEARREALEEAAKVADEAQNLNGRVAMTHPEDSDSRGRCLARARAAMYIAADIRALADKGEAEGWRPTHRHVKRGSTYRVIGEAEAQVSMAGRSDFPATARLIGDGDKLTVYQAEDGKLWVRFTDEFNDGRFVEIPAPPAGGRDGE